jgi:hypothetical protein
MLLEDDANIQKAFLDKFAELLRNSGLKTFEDVKDVTVYYLHKPHSSIAAASAAEE